MNPRAVLVTALLSGAALGANPVGPQSSDRPASVTAALVLVFDTDNLSPGSLRRAKDAASAFLRADLPDGTSVAVLAGARPVGERFTSNREILARTVSSIGPATGSVARQGDVPLDRSDDRANEIASDLYAGDRSGADAETRARRTMATLQAVSSTLAPLPGSKTIVWISDTFSAPSRDREKLAGHEDLVKAFLARSERVSIVVVGVDARGSGGALARDDLWSSLASGTAGSVLMGERNLAKALARAAGMTRTAASGATSPAAPPAAAAVEPPAPAPAAAPPPPPPTGVPVAAEPASVVPPAGVPSASSSGASAVNRLSPVASTARDPGLRESLRGSAAGFPDGLLHQARAGWDAYQAGDTKAARAALAVPAAHPSAPPWVHYVLGWAEFAEGNIDVARRQWTAVRREVPEFLRVYFDLADCSLQQQRPADALSVLREADARFPASAELMNAIGSVLSSLGRLNEAMRAFEQAIGRDASDSSAHFNLARTLELRYVQWVQAGRSVSAPPASATLPRRGLNQMSNAEGTIGTTSSGGKPDVGDLDLAAAEYRRAVALRGAETAEAAEGLRRTLAIDATKLDPKRPALLGSFNDAALDGFPVRLAWSSDGTYLCIGSWHIDNRGRVVRRPVRMITVWNGELTPSPELPDWAVRYWAWKSSLSSPWIPTRRIESERRHNQAMFYQGRPTSAEVLSYRLDGEVVGEAPPGTPGYGQGTTYSWSPFAMGALAYVDRRGSLMILDRFGGKVAVRGANGTISLPAWSPDGTSIAFLEKSTRGYDLKLVDIYPR